MFKRILVGTDGFGPASQAVARASELAADGGELLAVHAYTPPADEMPLRPSESAPGIDAGRGLLQDVEKAYGGPHLRTVLRAGDPSEILLDVAEEEDVDLIVVGNKGMSRAFQLGIVPNRVSHHAPCSVLIVKTVE